MKNTLMAVIIFANCFLSNGCFAAQLKKGHGIRDAEIERVLKSYLTPVFKTAGLNPDKLNLVLVYDPEVNAAATLDNTILVNTGLILKADSASEVIGVLSHETAHIADGHIIRTIGAYENATMQSLVGMLLGGILAVAAGNPDLGVGVLMGHQQMAQNLFMQHTRVQEGAADQGALRYLDHLGWSANGLLTFMEKLREHDPRSITDDIYTFTHPLTQERVSAFKYHLQQSGHKGGPLPPKFEEGFKRIKAKIQAFTLPLDQVQKEYAGNTSLDRYVRAIAFLRTSDFPKALTEVEILLKDHPKDPDYWDLKGQILFESAQVAEAVKAYGRAVELDPTSPLLRELWSQAMVESGDPSLLPQAEQELLRAAKEDPYSPFVWHLLAIAYGRQEKIGMSALAMAERNLLEGKFKDAANQAKRAKHYLEPEAPLRLRADDILHEVERLKKLRS